MFNILKPRAALETETSIKQLAREPKIMEKGLIKWLLTFLLWYFVYYAMFIFIKSQIFLVFVNNK